MISKLRQVLSDLKFIRECLAYPTVELLPEMDAWYSRANPILWANACGGRLHLYGNSQEAIEDSLMRGLKILEVDVCFTSDGIPVLSHLFEPNYEIQFDNVPSAKEFLSTKVNSRFTPLTFDRFLEKYAELEGVYFSVDPCSAGGKGNLLEYIREHVAESVCKKIIYQTYFLKTTRAAASFGFASVHFGVDYIFARRMYWRIPYLIRALKAIGVRSVSLQDRPITPDVIAGVGQFADAGLVVSVAKVDSVARARKWMAAGVRCFNTRMLSPADFDEGGSYGASN